MTIPDSLATACRLAAFGGVFALLAIAEALAPRRRLVASKSQRWATHLSLAALNNLLVRIALPITALETARLATERRWGLLTWVDWPEAAETLLAVLALDFAIWLQHVTFHAVPSLWRLHRAHHADLDLDVSSGVRFHTLEILLSMLIKCGCVVLLGPTVVAVLIFEILLNATSMFSHANIRLPAGLDRWLRLVLVTPDMHRIHHSTRPEETHSNFGFNLPWWDRLLGTYRADPAGEHEQLPLGLPELRDETRCERLDWVLRLPFGSLPAIGDAALGSGDVAASGPTATDAASTEHLMSQDPDGGLAVGDPPAR